MAEQPAHDVQIERDLAVVLADGTRLSGDLYRPAHSQPGPVLVSYYPYRKDDIIGSLFEDCRIRLCERGYASVFVDMAGTGASRGAWRCFELSSEGRDFTEVIEWVAAQEWCDGNVGAWGVSYGGMNALAAAACRPPHLRAIMAAYATNDIHRDSITRNGCNTMLGRYAWAAHMVALSLCPPTLQDSGGQWRRTWQERLRHLACGQPPAVNWQAHPEPDAYWRSRQVDVTTIDIPTMLIGGWADTYKDAIIRVFGEVRGPKKLVMGPWMHVLPHLSEASPYDWIADMADWWDTHLRPGSEQRSGPEAPVVFFADGEGWRAARSWPPAGVSQMQLFLAGHRLAAELPCAQQNGR
jgi:putative CocE/NonD family hydrolase